MTHIIYFVYVSNIVQSNNHRFFCVFVVQRRAHLTINPNMKCLLPLAVVLSVLVVATVAGYHPLSAKFIEQINEKSTTWKVCGDLYGLHVMWYTKFD